MSLKIRKKNVIRVEPFGYTFYDKTKLRHEFVLKNELDKTLKRRGVLRKDCDFLNTKRVDFRKDIVYSPIRIYYELTLACNLRCKSCFNRSGRPRRSELTTEEVFKSLHDLRENNVLDLRFTGGELTGRSDWFEILKLAKDLGFAVSCNTNAAYFDDEINRKFAELDIDQVTISIDGKKKSHEMNRGLHTFDRTVKNLKRMNKLGVKLRINTLINKNSLNDLEYMTELASKYTTEINFFITRFIGRGSKFKKEGNLVTFKEFYDMSKKADELRSKYPNLNILHFEQATISNSSRSGVYDKFGLKMGPPDGTTRFNIMSDGSLWAGGYIPYVDPSYCLGNIKENDVYDIWQKSEKLDEFREESKALEQYCLKCPKYATTCPGPNFELELLRKTHPDISNPYCYYGKGPSLLQIIEDKKKEKNHWEKAYFEYLTKRLDSGESKNIVVPTVVNIIKNQLEDKNLISILDVGCFSGAMLNRIFQNLPVKERKKVEMWGIDFDEKIIDQGNKKYPYINFVKTDLESTLPKLKKYDLIIISNVLHEIEDKKKTFNKIVNLLVPHGQLVILDGLKPNNDNKKIVIEFHDKKYFNSFVEFSKKYRAKKILSDKTKNLVLTTNIGSLIAYLTKARYMKEKYWNNESKQLYQFFSESEFRDMVENSGLSIIDFKLQFFSEEKIKRLFRSIQPQIELPAKNVLIVAKK